MSIKVSVDKVEELSNELANLKKEIVEKVYETFITMARVEVETVAKQNVPVDSGRLRASITTLTKESQTYQYTDREGNSFDGRLKSVQPKEYEVIVGTNVEYAEKIHDKGGGGKFAGRTSGGQKNPKGYGRGFLDNAFTQAIPKMVAAIRKIKGMSK
jgi:phage gpG-like protein